MNDKAAAVLKTFEELDAVPRRSKNEGPVRQWLTSWAAEQGFDHRVDNAGNVIVTVPATPGHESAPTVVLQGHMDMVCEKRPEVVHDFSSDPIRLVYEEEWVRADGTTLGADNGIAIALAMRIAEDPEVVHPPLELLFTVDEETGLTGALELEENSLSGRTLINLDSEEDDSLIVGCAGGRNSSVRIPIDRDTRGSAQTVLELTVSGLSGGHSGIDIHRNLANANRILARVLQQVEEVTPYRLCSLSGGTAHNAIPRDATARLTVADGAVEEVKSQIAEFEGVVQAEYRREESGLRLDLDAGVEANRGQETEKGEGAPLTVEASQRVVDVLLALPHGVFRMSDDIEGLVETSDNVATVGLEEDRLSVLVSQRSSVPSQLEAISAKINAVTRLAGGTAHYESEYPAWTPNMDSALLSKAVAVFEEVTGAKPKVQAIHAGLEAGVIGAKHEGMDMISLGPTIEGAHTPEERLHLESVSRIWEVLAALLAALS